MHRVKAKASARFTVATEITKRNLWQAKPPILEQAEQPLQLFRDSRTDPQTKQTHQGANLSDMTSLFRFI